MHLAAITHLTQQPVNRNKTVLVLNCLIHFVSFKPFIVDYLASYIATACKLRHQHCKTSHAFIFLSDSLQNHVPLAELVMVRPGKLILGNRPQYRPLSGYAIVYCLLGCQQKVISVHLQLILTTCSQMLYTETVGLIIQL